MSKKLILFLSLGFALFSFQSTGLAWSEQDVAQFEEANQAYREERFEEAATLYQALHERAPQSAAFLYNLGNTHFRLGRLGESILAYEQARALEPRNSDVLHNLKHVKGLLEYRVEDKRNWYLRAVEGFLKVVTMQEATFLAAFFYFLFIASWIFVLFFRQGTPWGWIRKTLLIVAVVNITLWSAKNFQERMFADAIVMSDDTQAHYGPSSKDQIAFRLGEGLKVYVVDARPSWSRVLLPSGETGWVANEKIAKVTG